MINDTEKNEAKTEAIAQSEELIDNCKSINNTLTIADVRPHFQTHYANAKKDVFGIMDLVKDILRDAQAELPRGIENTALRGIAIARSLFTAQILVEVQIRFSAGTTRYQPQSVSNCLSTYGAQDGTIGKIDLTKTEDPDRPCKGLRKKWYRVQVKPVQQ